MNVYSRRSQEIIDRLSLDLPQGILLYGPVGIGLKTSAQMIAACHTKQVLTIEPDEKGTISIETIRDLYTTGRSRGTGTVYIIDDADAMGREAQNALLKLLEEPNVSIRFILTSHVPERLLDTIRSRVGHFGLTPVSRQQSEQLLSHLAVESPTKRAQLLFIAEGLPAQLTRYATNESGFAERSATVRDARSFLQGTREDRLVASVRYKERAQAGALLKDMQKLVRRSIEADPQLSSADSLELLLNAESALMENASVRLTLTDLALAL